MILAETVTFGSAGLDRRADVREDAAKLAALLADPSSRAICMFKGKPLFNVETGLLAPLELHHEALKDASPWPLFLGVLDEKAYFAYDFSAWSPAEDNTDSAGFLDPSLTTHPALPDKLRFADLRANLSWISAKDGELAATARGILEWHRSHKFCANCGVKSEVAKGGWQRDCPACERSHFPRTDPVVITLITHENKVLVGRSPHWPEKMYSLLAGFMEPGETIEAAVRRETLEESGIKVGPVTYLASQPWPFPASLMIGCRGEAINTEITLDPNELEDAIWLTREEAALAEAGNHPTVETARKGSIAQFLVHNWLADRLD